MDESPTPVQEVARSGRVSWLTHPPAGVARIEVESHAFGALAVSLPEGDPVPHEATPGELLVSDPCGRPVPGKTSLAG
jgi:hypothetical protein